jgi:hypothetical protein
LRTRLRPVNVCCAIVASHFVARQGRTFRSAIAIAPGLNFDSFLSPGTNSRTKVLNGRRTPENAKRRAGRMTAPARPNLPRHGLKKPEIAYLPTACAETSPFLAPTVLSCCRPDMGWQSWKFEGQAR